MWIIKIRSISPEKQGFQVEKWLFLVPRGYLNLSYFLCISPFRLILRSCKFQGTGEGHEYLVQRWLPQTIFCLINTLLIILCLVGDLRSLNLGNLKNPSLYFKVMYKILVPISLIIHVKQMWLNQSYVVHVANFILHAKRNSLPFTEKKVILKIWGVMTIYLLIYFGYGVMGVFSTHHKPFIESSKEALGWRIWWMEMVQYGRLLLFLQKLEWDVVIKDFGATSDFDWFLGTVGFLGAFNRFSKKNK